MSTKNGSAVKKPVEVKIHDAADLSPDMTDEEFRELVEDIRVNGLIHKIVMLGASLAKSELLDGRHRWRALQELGMSLQPNSRLLSPKDVPDPWTFVLSTNLRRNHTVGQRAMMMAKYANRTSGRPPALISPIGLIKSEKDAAESINVGVNAIKQAKKVTEHGCVGLQRMVTNGTIAVSAAADVATLPKAEQAAIVRSGSDAVKEKAADLRKEAKESSKAESNGRVSNGKATKADETPVEREPGDDTETEAEANTKPKKTKAEKSASDERLNGQSAIDKVKNNLDEADKEIGKFIRAADDLKKSDTIKNHKFIVDNYKIFAKGLDKLREDFSSLNGAWNSSKK